MNKPAIPSNEHTYFEALSRITTAKSEKELKEAVDEAVLTMENYFHSQPLEELKASTIAMNQNPEDKDIKSKFTDNFNRFLYETAVEDGRYVSSKAHKDDYYYAKKLRANIIEENKITSQTEMAIVDMAVISYFRYLRISQVQIMLASQISTITGKDFQPKINLLKQYDKQVEASYRQFISSITFLKEIRQPHLSVKIQSKETFVAQNQQINKSP